MLCDDVPNSNQPDMQQKYPNKGHPCSQLNSWTSFSAFSCKWLNLRVPRLSFCPIIIFQACPLVLQGWVVWEFPNVTMKSAYKCMDVWGVLLPKKHTPYTHSNCMVDEERWTQKNNVTDFAPRERRETVARDTRLHWGFSFSYSSWIVPLFFLFCLLLPSQLQQGSAALQL